MLRRAGAAAAARFGRTGRVFLVGSLVMVGTTAFVGPANALSHRVPRLKMHSLFGIVTTVGSTSFDLASGGETITVEVTPFTDFREPRVHHPSFAGLGKGLTVGVIGTLVSSGHVGNKDITAWRVFISPRNHGLVANVEARKGASALSISGTVTSVAPSGFTLKSDASTVSVDVGTSTSYFENGVSSPGLVNVQDGFVVGVTRDAAPTSTSAAPVIDASGVYINPPDPAPPLPSSTTTTVAANGAPHGTAAGELAPGGTVSDLTSDSFRYTNGSVSVKVILSSWTAYYLNGTTGSISSLSTPGITVGTSGVLDPSSTASAVVVDAIHVYITTH